MIKVNTEQEVRYFICNFYEVLAEMVNNNITQINDNINDFITCKFESKYSNRYDLSKFVESMFNLIDKDLLDNNYKQSIFTLLGEFAKYFFEVSIDPDNNEIMLNSTEDILCAFFSSAIRTLSSPSIKLINDLELENALINSIVNHQSDEDNTDLNISDFKDQLSDKRLKDITVGLDLICLISLGCTLTEFIENMEKEKAPIELP